MEKYSQRDPRWAHERLGRSELTVGKYGCTTTAICMVHSKFYGGGLLPREAARTFKYTYGLPGDKNGLIIWTQCNYQGMKFVKRGYWANMVEIEKYANDPNKGVILEVDGGKHWVAVKEFVNGAPVIIDPWGGKEFASPGENDYKVTGYTLFEKEELKSQEKPAHWADEAMKWATSEKLITKPKDPNGPVTWGELIVVLYRLASLLVK